MSIQNLDTEVILLLTSHFKSTQGAGYKPLTPSEWSKFAIWLRKEGLFPKNLLETNLHNTISGWQDPKVTYERISYLLNRGMALAMAYEKWESMGIWVVSRADADYPKKIKASLGTTSPPVFYGCGNRKLLLTQSIGVVGSRDVPEEDTAFAEEIGKWISKSGYSVVSGGAKGSDYTSMVGALSVDGTVIGVLADSLKNAATSRKYRSPLMSDNLVLISPYYPDARFTPANAMGRNKFIYTLSEATIVIHSKDKGGTWNGAVENLKKKWVPLFVYKTNDQGAANSKLVSKGGSWIDRATLSSDLQSMITAKRVVLEQSSPQSLFEFSTPNSGPPSKANEKEIKAQPQVDIIEDAKENDAANDSQYNSLFQIFEARLIKILEKSGHVSNKELEGHFELVPSQLIAWLKPLLQDGKIKKHLRPLRYSLVADQSLKFEKPE